MESDIFGVCLSFSQRSPFAEQNPLNGKKDHYKLMSHFDELRIDIVTSSSDFMKENQEYNENYLLEASTESRKVLCYCVGDTGATKVWGSAAEQQSFITNLPSAYMRGKPFIAVIGVKLCRHFFQHQREKRKHTPNACDAFICISDVLRVKCGFAPIIDYCMLRCLGAEDMYILCQADSIEKLLTVLHSLRAFRCSLKNEELTCSGLIESNAVVLETHSHFGFWADLKPENISGDAAKSIFLFEFQMRQYAGASTTNMIDVLNRSGFEYDNIHRTAGRYGLIARGLFNLPSLIEFYSQVELDWRQTNHHKHQINYSTGRFLADYKTALTSVEGSLEKSYIEGIKAINKISSSFADLMDTVIDKEYIDNDNIREFASICAIGCQRLHRTYYWGEYRDVLHFFQHFLEHLKAEWEYRNSMNIEDKKSYGVHLLESIGTFCVNMSTVLNDRVMLDRPLQENVRRSVYDTGAYEDLIQFYRAFIYEQRQLYRHISKMDGWKTKLNEMHAHFLFVPTLHGTVQSKDLFPFGVMPVYEEKPDDTYEFLPQTMCLFFMSAKDLWKYRTSMILLCHEVGHYLFIYDKQLTISTFVNVVVIGFVDALMFRLRCIQYPSAPKGLASGKGKKLMSELQTFLVGELSACLENPNHNPKPFHKNLDIAVSTVMTSFRRVLQDQFDSAGVNDIQEYAKRRINANIAGGALIQRILEVYDAYDLLPMVSRSSAGFFDLLINIMTNACDFARSAISECRADAYAISLLDLKLEEYYHTLIDVQERKDALVSREARTLNVPLSAIRLLNAAIGIHAREKTVHTKHP